MIQFLKNIIWPPDAPKKSFVDCEGYISGSWVKYFLSALTEDSDITPFRKKLSTCLLTYTYDIFIGDIKVAEYLGTTTGDYFTLTKIGIETKDIVIKCMIEIAEKEIKLEEVRKQEQKNKVQQEIQKVKERLS